MERHRFRPSNLIRTLKLLMPAALIAGLAISSHAASKTILKAAGMCRATEAPLFDCDLTSGGHIALCLEQRGHQMVTLVEGPSGRRRALSDLKGSFSGFAHGDNVVLQGRNANMQIDVFATIGGVPDQTSGAISMKGSRTTASEFCDAETIQLPRSGRQSILSLGRDHIAGDLDDVPDYPVDPNPED